MATLPWTDLAPNVKCIATTKQFFGKYLYKIDVDVPAARILLDRRTKTIKWLLNERINEAKDTIDRLANWGRQQNIPFSGWYRVINDSSLVQLEYYKKIIEQHKGAIKIRIEEPTLSIYCDDEQILFDIAGNDPLQRLERVFKPESATAQTVLKSGEIIVRKPTDYLYKIVFREGKVTNKDNNLQIYNYLTSLGDEVKMTQGCATNLKYRQHWMTSCYFYAKDTQVLTFLNLIAPEKVSGIFKLVYLEK
jgi:hypothetical protein